MKDRRIMNENGLMVFPERERPDFSKMKGIEPQYSGDYHNPSIAKTLREIIKRANGELGK